MITFEEATATIREWLDGGASTPHLARELSEWALWALADGGDPTHEIIPVAEADRLRAIEAAARWLFTNDNGDDAINDPFMRGALDGLRDSLAVYGNGWKPW